MKILLATSEDDFIRHEYGKTWAEKKSRFDHKMRDEHFRNYFTVLNAYDGQWVVSEDGGKILFDPKLEEGKKS